MQRWSRRDVRIAGRTVMHHARLIGSLGTAIRTTVRRLVEGAQTVALVDFPSYANVGDSAIWLGALKVLAAVDAPPPCYTCDIGTYRRDHMTRRLGHGANRGVILLTGGGNLGDLWPRHQELREEIISSFPDHRIVQLPQSIHFGDRGALDRARRIFDSHSDLTLLVRDARSLEIAQTEFRAPSELCPDLALGLGALERSGSPVRDLVWLSRSDRESARLTGPETSAEVPIDWNREERSALIKATDTARRLAAPRSWLLRALRGPLSATYSSLARGRLERGRRLLSAGRVVMTDRLHGHVLALLMGIPHVLLPDATGKIRGFYERWTSDSDLVDWADTPDEGIDRVRMILQGSALGAGLELGADPSGAES